jgi:prevent-host-death family protein
MSWQLQEAKQKFSELVRRTLEEGPQVVTKHARRSSWWFRLRSSGG